MQLSRTSSKILSVLLANPDQSFYINELVRHTSSYPNSIYSALKTLEKQKIVTSFQNGRFKFFRVNTDYENLPEIKGIIEKASGNFQSQKLGWIKLLNREADYAFTLSVCLSNRDKLGEIYGVNVPTFWYNNLTSGLYYIQDEITALGRKVNDLLEQKPEFARADIKNCRAIAETLVKESQQIFISNLKD